MLEKQGILGSAPGRRPGDVTIPNWTGGKGLAIDVAVTSPFAAQHLKKESPCEYYAESYKHAKYQKDFVGTEYLFAAVVWETTGAINAEGEDVLKQIMKFAAQRQGREVSSFCGRQWALFSCCLQRSVAKMIWLRSSGQIDCDNQSNLN